MTNQPTSSPSLSRQLGLLGLTATGICSMIGASIYIVPIMIQRNVTGIGDYVLPAFVVAAIPALLAAFAYASLSSAMPRAGGSYIYASRGLNPYLGFVASFSQWFGLSIVIGVICYVIIPFFRDIAQALNWPLVATYLETGWVRLALALSLLWLFIGINMRGLQFYERTLIPLMVLMFVLGGIVIFAGFSFNHADFEAALLAKEGRTIPHTGSAVFNLSTFLSAAAVLFASFIGFDSIAQAGGEAKNPEKLLPRAIALAVVVVSCFYFVFTSAVYHAIPWQFIAAEALKKDISAPGLFSVLLSPTWGLAILIGATIALLNDLPAMLLSVSRLLFAWAEDGIFPKNIAAIHPKTQTPRTALFISGCMATIGILGSHFAGDFFLGVDIMVTSMLVNFLLMCLTLLVLPHKNPAIAQNIKVLTSDTLRGLLAGLGVLILSVFLVIHLWKDLNATVTQWYFHSTYIWLIVMGLASFIYFLQVKRLVKKGVDVENLFKKLPLE
jgi:basic amino acid/polyamine antiporter, APA family